MSGVNTVYKRLRRCQLRAFSGLKTAVGATDAAEDSDDDDAAILEKTVREADDVADDADAVVPIDEELADSDSDDGSATDSDEECPEKDQDSADVAIETDTADLD